MTAPGWTCTCGGTRLTDAVALVLLFAPMLERPYPLIPAEEYRLCVHCEAPIRFVTRAQEGCAATREAGAWTHAIIVCDDGEGLHLTQGVDERPTQKGASA